MAVRRTLRLRAGKSEGNMRFRAVNGIMVGLLACGCASVSSPAPPDEEPTQVPEIASVQPAVAAHWDSLLAALVPALEARVAADADVQPAPQGRLRVGLYMYQEAGPDDLSVAPATPPRRRIARKEDPS